MWCRHKFGRENTKNSALPLLNIICAATDANQRSLHRRLLRIITSIPPPNARPGVCLPRVKYIFRQPSNTSLITNLSRNRLAVIRIIFVVAYTPAQAHTQTTVCSRHTNWWTFNLHGRVCVRPAVSAANV